jgi:toxin ParE1/3/4
MSAYRLRPRAEADLAEIWRFTADRWDSVQADRYVLAIIGVLDAIGASPAIGQTCDEVREGYRRHPAGSHVVFYRIESDHVDVVRILHGRMDIRRQL